MARYSRLEHQYWTRSSSTSSTLSADRNLPPLSQNQAAKENPERTKYQYEHTSERKQESQFPSEHKRHALQRLSLVLACMRYFLKLFVSRLLEPSGYAHGRQYLKSNTKNNKTGSRSSHRNNFQASRARIDAKILTPALQIKQVLIPKRHATISSTSTHLTRAHLTKRA